jgi:ketosteroid isomerase-like protein
VVDAFTECINHRDLDGLAALMTDDHTFVDAEGTTVTGRAQCIAAWRRFTRIMPLIVLGPVAAGAAGWCAVTA